MKTVIDGISAILSGNAFANAFWVFVGIVAGALIQYLLGWLSLRSQRRNARRLFGVEATINRQALDDLKESFRRKKDRFVAGQVADTDYYIDMSRFNYRIVDPLVNSGHFHDILGPEGVQRYFRYAGDLNIENAKSLLAIFRQEAESGRSLNFLDWIVDTKFPEWDGHLDFVERRIGESIYLPRNEYARIKQPGRK